MRCSGYRCGAAPNCAALATGAALRVIALLWLQARPTTDDQPYRRPTSRVRGERARRCSRPSATHRTFSSLCLTPKLHPPYVEPLGEARALCDRAGVCRLLFNSGVFAACFSTLEQDLSALCCGWRCRRVRLCACVRTRARAGGRAAGRSVLRGDISAGGRPRSDWCVSRLLEESVWLP